MTHPETEDDKDEPYSPEALEIMAKARRRAAVSMLVMLIGFMTIAAVVVYRLIAMGSGIEDRYVLEAIALPAGAEVISAQAQDGLVTLAYSLDGATAIRIHDGRTGELVREIAVVTE